MVVTNNKELADKIRHLKNLAHPPLRNYDHDAIGFNYRMANSQARLALQSLRNFKRNIAKRQKVADWFDESIPNWLKTEKRDVVWIYDVYSVNPAYIIKNIPGARYMFRPMSSLAPYRTQEPPSVVYSQRVIIPVKPEMKRSEVLAIAKKLQNLL